MLMKKVNNCISCQMELNGRSDKRFCSTACKNDFNNQLRKLTIKETAIIDAYLHRNREILMHVMGSHKKIQIDKLQLSKARFKFEYHTGHYINKEAKTYWQVYDFAWMEFSDQKILIVRKSM